MREFGMVVAAFGLFLLVLLICAVSQLGIGVAFFLGADAFIFGILVGFIADARGRAWGGWMGAQRSSCLCGTLCPLW